LTKRPERLWGPPILPPNGYRHSFLGVQRPGVKLTAHFHPEPWLRMSGAIPLLPLYALLTCRAILPLLVRAMVTVLTPTVITVIITKIYILQHTVLRFYIKLSLVGKLAQCGRQVQRSSTHATELRRRTSTETVAYKRTHPYNYKVNSEAKTVQAHGLCNFLKLRNSFDKYWLLFQMIHVRPLSN